MTFLFVANSDTTYRSLVFTYINEDTKQLANCVKPSARHGIFLRCFCTYNQLQSGILFTAVDCTNPKAFSDVLVVVSVTLGHERSMPLVFLFSSFPRSRSPGKPLTATLSCPAAAASVTPAVTVTTPPAEGSTEPAFSSQPGTDRCLVIEEEDKPPNPFLQQGLRKVNVRLH